MLLEGRTAVIYGGSGAIGSAVARVFAREGARLYLAGRTQERLDGVAREIAAGGGTVETARLDVLDQRAVAEQAARVAERAGGIDIVLNAVSFPHVQGTPLVDLSLEAFLLPIESFLRALFITSKAVAPYMGKRRPGVILTLSTPGAKLASAGDLGHVVSVAGTEAFSRVLAAELAASNVRVVCIRPHAISDAPAAGSYTQELFAQRGAAAGVTGAELLAAFAQQTMLKRLPTLADVAEMAAFLASDKAAAITGTVANLTGGALVD